MNGVHACVCVCYTRDMFLNQILRISYNVFRLYLFPQFLFPFLPTQLCILREKKSLSTTVCATHILFVKEFLTLFLFFWYEGVLPAREYVCVHLCTCNGLGGQKRASEFLEQEIVASCQAGARIPTQVLWKSSRCSSPMSSFSSFPVCSCLTFLWSHTSKENWLFIS